MHCGVMVTGYNQADWPRLMAGDYDRAPAVPDYVNMETTLACGDLVEPLGFDSIWATEHSGSAYSMPPNPIAVAGLLGRPDVTGRCRHRRGRRPWWNPVRLAHRPGWRPRTGSARCSSLETIWM
jgi:hypothetical protein